MNTVKLLVVAALLLTTSPIYTYSQCPIGWKYIVVNSAAGACPWKIELCAFYDNTVTPNVLHMNVLSAKTIAGCPCVTKAGLVNQFNANIFPSVVLQLAAQGINISIPVCPNPIPSPPDPADYGLILKYSWSNCATDCLNRLETETFSDGQEHEVFSSSDCNTSTSCFHTYGVCCPASPTLGCPPIAYHFADFGVETGGITPECGVQVVITKEYPLGHTYQCYPQCP